MSDLVLSFVTENDEFALRLNADNLTEHPAAVELIAIFGSVKSDRASVNFIQRSSEALKASIDAYTERYKDLSPYLNRLNKNIRNLDVGNYFLVLPREILEGERLELQTFVSSLNMSSSFEEAVQIYEKLTNEHAAYFSMVLENYNLHWIRTDRPVNIGEFNRDLRVCRFCGNGKEQGATFRIKAHAIPESVGNKNIVLLDECDTCNKYFGDNVEPSFTEYFNIPRVYLGVKGKNGYPVLKYKNAEIYNNGDAVIFKTSAHEEPSPGRLKITLEPFSKNLVPENVYRIFAKMAVSVINSSELVGLDRTIAWIRHGEKRCESLPKVASNVVKMRFDGSPSLTVYVRKTENQEIPHMVGEFRLGQFVHVFIVPFSGKDSKTFVSDAEYASFWAAFQHYSSLSGWKHEGFSSSDAVYAKQIINFEPRDGDT